MKNKSAFVFFQGIIVLLAILITENIAAQFTTRTDPVNPKRKIIEYSPIVRKTVQIKPTRNLLDDPRIKRPAIPFKKFELINPRTQKPIDPKKNMTIKLKNGQQRIVNVQKFFDELNAMESALAARGKSLRIPATFSDVKPAFNRRSYSRAPKLKSGYRTGVFTVNKTKPRSLKYQRSSVLKVVKPDPFTVVTGANPNTVIGGGINNIKPIGSAGNRNTDITTGNRNTGGTTTVDPVIPGGLKIVNVTANLYIASRFENHGQPEFPAEWKKTTLNGTGRKIFPIVIQVPKGTDVLIKRIDWQASRVPFDGTSKEVLVQGIEQSGTQNPVTWLMTVRGASELPKFQDFKYAALYVDLSGEAEDEKMIIPFYVRAICYNAAGEVLKITEQVIANYGSITKPFKIAPTSTNTVPGFNYKFPDVDDMPFGVVIKGGGIGTVKTTEYKNEDYENLLNRGYKVWANASLGVKYFNFLSLVDPNASISSELTLVHGNFNAIMGLGTGPSGGNEDQGVSLNLSFLNGIYNYPAIEFTTPVPNVPNTVSLEYDIVQNLDMQLLDMWLLIGPVPIHIAAGITGEAGIKLFGQANLKTFEVSGGIKPFLNTRFDASGGVDALIAYATLNAEVNPLLSVELPLTFSSGNSKPVSFNSSVAGLAGRVFLKVGFFYPCPDLEKIVGWLTGDEDTPLCECAYEYNIFDFPGFAHTYGY